MCLGLNTAYVSTLLSIVCHKRFPVEIDAQTIWAICMRSKMSILSFFIVDRLCYSPSTRIFLNIHMCWLFFIQNCHTVAALSQIRPGFDFKCWAINIDIYLNNRRLGPTKRHMYFIRSVVSQSMQRHVQSNDKRRSFRYTRYRMIPFFICCGQISHWLIFQFKPLDYVLIKRLKKCEESRHSLVFSFTWFCIYTLTIIHLQLAF